MNKEIRDYQEAMFFGLNFRQCAFSVLAIIVAVGIYFGTRKIAIDEIRGWLCMLGAAPFAACGFFQYHGMTAEQFLWAFIKSEFLYPKKLSFQPENLYYACLEEAIQQGEKAGRRKTKKQGNKEAEPEERNARKLERERRRHRKTDRKGRRNRRYRREAQRRRTQKRRFKRKGRRNAVD